MNNFIYYYELFNANLIDHHFSKYLFNIYFIKFYIFLYTIIVIRVIQVIFFVIS